MAVSHTSPAVSGASLPGEGAPSERPTGLTLRAVFLSLALAFGFGYLVPVVDMKMQNTFLGATHLPPGAIAVLLVLLLAINPLLHALNRKPARQIQLGSVLLASALLAGFCYLRTGFSSFLFWISASVAALLLVTFLLNIGRKPLSRNEILTVYISCLFSALAPGHGAENVFIVNLVGPFYYATRENKWLSFLEPHLKPWMTPALSQGGGYDKNDAARDVVSGWFNNTPTGEVPWGAWIVPMIAWGIAIFLMYVMMACICVMIRKQWAEREALAFPLLRLPLELTEDVDRPEKGVLGGFFSNNLMWVGFGIAVFIQALRGLHLYFPDVPTFPLDVNTDTLFTEAPWNQISWTPITIWPVVVGITYLLTTEVSFSFWAFYWIVKFELVAAYLLGFQPNAMPNAIGGFGYGAKVFTLYQLIGCYFAYVFIVLYTGREHLKHIALRAFGRRKADAEEATEALSYPVAFWGFVLSFGLIVAWSVAAGINPGLAITMWLLYLVTIIALTRIISEAGILFVQQGWGPLGTLGEIMGAGGKFGLLNETSLPPAAMIQGSLMTDLRGFVMPSFIQGFKLAHDRKIALKPLLFLMMACSLITVAMGSYFNVKFGYQRGGLALDSWYATGASRAPADVAGSLIKGVSSASWGNLSWVAVGVVMTYAFMLARSRFSWFPLHPIGFLLSQCYPIHQIWFSIFLGWLAKVVITKFGGSDTYRKTTPLFLGLALGDVAMMLFWLVIDAWQGKLGHKLMPG